MGRKWTLFYSNIRIRIYNLISIYFRIILNILLKKLRNREFWLRNFLISFILILIVKFMELLIWIRLMSKIRICFIGNIYLIKIKYNFI